MMKDANSASSQKRASSPSTAVEGSNTLSRHMGYFPMYVPDSFSVANASFGDIDPPPYPTDSLVHSQDPPPYPLEELSGGKNLPPYPVSHMGSNSPSPMKMHSAYFAQEGAGPSTPTITELNHKLRLTPSEREEIIDSLAQMKKAVEEKTETEKRKFLNAQKKLKNLLLEARPKLTEADKVEFINEVKRIKEIKNEKELSRVKEEKKERLPSGTERRKSSQPREECHCDIWSIIFKTFQLGMVILAYAENKQWKTTQLFIFLCFFTTVSTICLLIFYSFGRRPPLIVLKTECIYCILCILGFYTATFTQTWRSFKMPLFGVGAMVGYALDIIRIFCLLKKRISFSSTLPELRKSNSDHSPRRGGSYDSGHHHLDNSTNSSTHCLRNVVHTNVLDEAFLDLDFLNDNCYEKDVGNHNDRHHHNSSHHHLNSLLPPNTDHYRSSQFYSTNNHFTNSDQNNAQNKMRLLLNPIVV